MEAQAQARKPVVWEDLTTGKFHAINNETGEEVPVDRDGRPIAQFHLGVSGTATTKARMSLRLKDVALQKSLGGPEPPRPAALKDAGLFRSLREDRVETRGRFRSKLSPEAGLFLTSQRRMNETFPEMVEAAQAEEAKARRKIEELHKNYYALQASNDAGGKASTQQQTSQREIKNVSKSKTVSFTSTGVFRP